MILLYGLILLILLIYSYSLIDLNLTLINHPLWQNFRASIIQLGYYHRDWSWLVYAGLVILLFFFHLYFLKYHSKHNGLKVGLIVAVVLVGAYPLITHDLFNYIFDARIVTFYHKNPYELFAGFFYNDPWLRFMHWTGRRYPYGPIFLPLTLIPSFLGGTKFLLNFIFFKTFFVSFYLWAVYRLKKINNRWSLYFATQPLIIIEGLVASHNDLIGVSLAVIGVTYLIENRHRWLGYLFLIFSVGIKYITLPYLLFSRSNNKVIYVILLFVIGILIFINQGSEIQPWYFLALLALIPLYDNVLPKLNLFFAGLLFSYYPYIRLGGWDATWKVSLKHEIILVFALINVVYIIGSSTHFFSKKKFSSK